MTDRKPTVRRRIHGLMFKLPLMITCEAFEDFILAYLEGELTRRQEFVFELHLKMCRECRDYLTAYRSSMRLAKDGFAREDEAVLPETVPEDLIKAVLDAREK